MSFMNLKEIFNKVAFGDAAVSSPENAAASQAAAVRHIDLIVCQDYEAIPEDAKAIGKLLRKQGHDVRVESVEHKTQLLSLLKERYKKGDPAPTDIFLDVSGGNGANAALEAIRYIEKKYPDAPLPTVNFCSCSLSMAIDAACKLREADDRFLASAIDTEELSWTRGLLEGNRSEHKPTTFTLRNVLNEKLGCSLPLDHRETGSYAERLKNMNAVANDSILSAWRRGKVPAQEAIERMRTYATGLAQSLRSGFYLQGNQDINLEQDAAFYGAAGFPRKGRVVFSLQEVEDARYDGEKPVLVMKGYDPEVVPLLADGKLGGLVVTSSYMASHLKLLCETHMVSGLFGVMPKGQKTMRGEFNEEAQPQGSPYFEGREVHIAGQTIRRGQNVLLCLKGNGMVFNPPASMEVKTIDADSIEQNKQLKDDIANLRRMKLCFKQYFREQGIKAHDVKANVDSGNEDQLRLIDGIGLVRTEQMVAMSRYMMGNLKRVLLYDDDYCSRNLAGNCEEVYRSIVGKLNVGLPVKIRLFDFVHSEILDKDEQGEFLEKYPKLEIHGGEALATWPRLYRDQIDSIFKALKGETITSEVPLEIMMPAVRTKQDVLDIRQMIEEEAKKVGIKPHQYSFGVMVETLDSCRNIEEIAPLCDFISFGTNDLTQQYTDMSRSDLKAHARYAEKHGYDPFKTLAPEILEMVQDVTARGRHANPALKVDICGGQAADPATAMKLFDAGIDNISVAPNLGNLYGLPMLLDYQLYDASRAPAAVKPAAAVAVPAQV